MARTWHLPALGIALLLAGCASGSCSHQRLLRPTASAAGGFSVVIEPERDTLFLEARNIALWLYPCDDPTSRFLVDATLCGTVIVPPGTRFRFAEATVHLLNPPPPGALLIRVQPLNFEVGTAEIGVSEPGVSSWLASRPYKLPGSRLQFILIKEPYAAAPIQFVLPPFEVDAVRMTFPVIRLAPGSERRCYHGPW